MAAFPALAGESQAGVHSLLEVLAMHAGDELQVVNIRGPAVKKGEVLAPYKGEDRLASACADGDRVQPKSVDSHVRSRCRTRASRRQASLCLLAVEAAWGGEGISSQGGDRLEPCRLCQGSVHLWVP